MSIERNVEYSVEERKRTYIFPGGDKLELCDVRGFRVSDSGRHYVTTANGLTYIVQHGWLGIIIDGKLVVS